MYLKLSSNGPRKQSVFYKRSQCWRPYLPPPGREIKPGKQGKAANPNLCRRQASQEELLGMKTNRLSPGSTTILIYFMLVMISSGSLDSSTILMCVQLP